MQKTALTLVPKFTKAPEHDIESAMFWLSQYGKPRLCSQGNGEWFCAIEMFVQGAGVSFDVRSDFKEKSMLDAIRVCVERLEKALSDLGVEVK